MVIKCVCASNIILSHIEKCIPLLCVRKVKLNKTVNVRIT